MFGKIWSFLTGKKTKIGAGLIIIGKVMEKAGSLVGPLIGVDGATLEKIGTVVEQVGTGVATIGIGHVVVDAATGGRVPAPAESPAS